MKQPFERPDHTRFLEGLGLELPFAQYTPALVDPPEGAEVVDDWLVYYALAQRLGLSLDVAGPLDMAETPTSDALLDRLATGATVPLAAVRPHPSGAVFDRPAPLVQPARRDRQARLTVAPRDVLDELADCHAAMTVPATAGTHLLVSRRERETMNSFGRDLPGTRKRFPRNAAWMAPADAAALGVADGDRVRITADADAIIAEVRIDAAVRPGVVSMSHGWGGLPETSDPGRDGASTARLVARDRAVQTINAMPRLSAIPVRLERAG